MSKSTEASEETLLPAGVPRPVPLDKLSRLRANFAASPALFPRYSRCNSGSFTPFSG